MNNNQFLINKSDAIWDVLIMCAQAQEQKSTSVASFKDIFINGDVMYFTDGRRMHIAKGDLIKETFKDFAPGHYSFSKTKNIAIINKENNGKETTRFLSIVDSEDKKIKVDEVKYSKKGKHEKTFAEYVMFKINNYVNHKHINDLTIQDKVWEIFVTNSRKHHFYMETNYENDVRFQALIMPLLFSEYSSEKIKYTED